MLPVYELGLDEQRGLFYTTRFVEGETLAEFLSRLAANDEQVLARFSLHHLLNIWQRVCDAVAYAHSRGVIHGTLRPEAVEVGIFGEVFVTHWGSAITTAESPDDPDRVFVATIAAAPALCEYSAPEQAGGQFEDIDERTDVFALGGLLYRILTLRNPLAADNDDACSKLRSTRKSLRPRNFTRTRHARTGRVGGCPSFPPLSR